MPAVIEKRMKRLKHFIAIELGNDEAPGVGCIINAMNFPEGFKLRFMEMLEEYYDHDDIHFTEPVPDFWDGSPYWDIPIMEVQIY